MFKKIIKYIKFYCWYRFFVPKGIYCYKEISFDWNANPPTRKTKKCPYWDLIEDRESQENGYCHFLEMGDLEINENGGMGLLWDQCKECNIKYDFEDFYEN